jgi:hypothetical protein
MAAAALMLDVTVVLDDRRVPTIARVTTTNGRMDVSQDLTDADADAEAFAYVSCRGGLLCVSYYEASPLRSGGGVRVVAYPPARCNERCLLWAPTEIAIRSSPGGWEDATPRLIAGRAVETVLKAALSVR